MPDARIEWNAQEFNKLARTPELESALRRICDQIANRAGDGHEAETYQGADRVRGVVRTASFAAAKAEAQDRNLTRSVDAGRV